MKIFCIKKYCMIGRGNVYLWSTIAEEPPQFWRFRLQEVSPILAASVPATGGETTKQNINQSSSSELHWTKLKNECSATKIEFIKKPTLLGGLSSAKVWAKSVFRITCTSIRIRVRSQADSDPCPASLIKIIIQYVVAVIIRSFCCFPEPSFFNPLVNFLRFTEWLLVFFASQVGSGKMMRIRSDTGRNLQQFVFL